MILLTWLKSIKHPHEQHGDLITLLSPIKEIKLGKKKTGQDYQIICRIRPHCSSKGRSDMSEKYSNAECGAGGVSAISVNRLWGGWALNTQTIDWLIILSLPVITERRLL
jgi:hypothetical protein